MFRVYVFAIIIALAFCPVPTPGAQPAHRILTHTFGSAPQTILVTLMDVLPDGPVEILTSANAPHLRRSVSHADFEQMWNTLLANGARQLHSTGPAKILDSAHNYYFSLAEVPSGTGHKFIKPKTLLVPVDSAPSAVAAVAHHIRGLL